MTAPAGLTVRVWVTDVWDNLELVVSPEDTFGSVKVEALSRSGAGGDPGAYEVKYRGALVTDEAQTLGAAAVPNGAPMVILPTRRRPVR